MAKTSSDTLRALPILRKRVFDDRRVGCAAVFYACQIAPLRGLSSLHLDDFGALGYFCNAGTRHAVPLRNSGC
jgi:hypothetical protein